MGGGEGRGGGKGRRRGGEEVVFYSHHKKPRHLICLLICECLQTQFLLWLLPLCSPFCLLDLTNTYTHTHTYTHSLSLLSLSGQCTLRRVNWSSRATTHQWRTVRRCWTANLSYCRPSYRDWTTHRTEEEEKEGGRTNSAIEEERECVCVCVF